MLEIFVQGEVELVYNVGIVGKENEEEFYEDLGTKNRIICLSGP
jgi:hypothetical protein